MTLSGNLLVAGGSHVIRYNECWSDLEHMYNDIIGGNLISHCGHQYMLHNTLFRSDEWLPRGGLGGNRLVKRTVSRNNILKVRAPRDYSASENKQNADNDFDFDLHNGRIPPSQEMQGVRGEPVYAIDADFDLTTKTGRFQLAPDSPGASAGKIIPNFSDGYPGSAPDVGAHPRGAPPRRYGVTAHQP